MKTYKKWSEIKHKMSPERRAYLEACERAALVEDARVARSLKRRAQVRYTLRLLAYAVVGLLTGMALSYLVGIGWTIVIGVVAYIFLSTLSIYVKK